MSSHEERSYAKSAVPYRPCPGDTTNARVAHFAFVRHHAAISRRVQVRATDTPAILNRFIAALLDHCRVVTVGWEMFPPTTAVMGHAHPPSLRAMLGVRQDRGCILQTSCIDAASSKLLLKHLSISSHARLEPCCGLAPIRPAPGASEAHPAETAVRRPFPSMTHCSHYHRWSSNRTQPQTRHTRCRLRTSAAFVDRSWSQPLP